ncbi:uncharacterized protein LOC126968990 [Leptidea sinapis]|uniref:uncharacterized protein LOC126968990 n=1 Tax=Leptidea sinapis TaxID=189913 RepID=UPI002138F433|nr:uncharacterized protein LOC126968990 [Leptidea sinapis]
MADSRRRVTYGQLELLWEYLNQNKALATGFNKTTQARQFSKNMWQNIAQTLNSYGDGAVKDWKGWCKYWNDYKSKLKKLAATTKASHHQTAEEGRKLTDIEKKFLQILEGDFGTGLLGMRVKPFEQDIQETEGSLDMALNIGASSITTQPIVLKEEIEEEESILTLGPVDFHEGPEIMEPGPSRVTHPPPVLSPSGAPELKITPLRSQHRRRHMRREPPMTQDAALRALVCVSEKRAKIEEQNSETLKKLLQEMKEIKEILRLRSVRHPIDGK